MDLEEYKKQVKKVKQSRVHKITNSYGAMDYYRYYRKHRPKESKYILTDSQYYAIIRSVNQKLADKIAYGQSVTLPRRMGEIEVLKNNGNLKLSSDGKVIKKMRIDWDKTLQLWYEDPEARQNKQCVRFESLYNYKISYRRTNTRYKNAWYMTFQPNRLLKKRVSYNIKNNILIDTFSENNERTVDFN